MTKQVTRASLLLALCFEALIFGWTPGLGQLLFWGLALGTTVLLNRAAERPALPKGWMFVPPGMFALSVTLYDAQVVQFWGTILGLLSLLWAIAWNLLQEAEFAALARLFPSHSFDPERFGGQTIKLWTSSLDLSLDRQQIWKARLRGALLSVPLIMIFATLLASADLVFEQTLQGFQDHLALLSPWLPLRLALGMIFLAGVLSFWLSAPQATAPQVKKSFGTIELSVALGSLNLLLSGFLAIQLRYLFGGKAALEALGLNYADYARQGFFELAACIALILPLVMMGIRTAEAENERTPRILGGLLVLQAAGLALSAFRRMLVYMEAYGLSIDRVYAAAGILVAITVLAWALYACCKTEPVSWVLARQTVTVFFLLGFLALVDVEARVAQVNLTRAIYMDKDLDIHYLSLLSCDVLPTLEQNLGLLPKEQDLQLYQAIKSIRTRTDKTVGPSWNLSRVRAGFP